MILPTVTVEDVLSWRPCYLDDVGGEEKVRDLATPLGDRFDALGILRADHILAADRLWTVLREEMIPAEILHEFACRAAEWALVLVALGGAEIDPRSVVAIATKRRWVRGEASDEELIAAWSAAWSAVEGTACSTSNAAWSAADAASVGWSADRSADRGATHAAMRSTHAAWITVHAAWRATGRSACRAADASYNIRVEELIAVLEGAP